MKKRQLEFQNVPNKSLTCEKTTNKINKSNELQENVEINY